jgi:hypothetical protein
VRPVRGGIQGDPPYLGDGGGGEPVTTDFRRVYVTLLDWMGIDASAAVPGAHERLAYLA